MLFYHGRRTEQDDQRRDTVRASQLAWQSYHDPHRALPCKFKPVQEAKHNDVEGKVMLTMSNSLYRHDYETTGFERQRQEESGDSEKGGSLDMSTIKRPYPASTLL